MKGLYNLGNSCYINSTLQLLVRGHVNFDVMGSDDGPNGKRSVEARKKMYNNLKRVMSQIDESYRYYRGLCKNSENNSATECIEIDDLYDLKDTIDNVYADFSGYEQHDAHDLLLALMDLGYSFVQQNEVTSDKVRERINETVVALENWSFKYDNRDRPIHPSKVPPRPKTLTESDILREYAVAEWDYYKTQISTLRTSQLMTKNYTKECIGAGDGHELAGGVAEGADSPLCSLNIRQDSSYSKSEKKLKEKAKSSPSSTTLDKDRNKERDLQFVRGYYTFLESKITCPRCGYYSIKYEVTPILSLSVWKDDPTGGSPICSFGDSISDFLKNERVIGWKCPKKCFQMPIFGTLLGSSRSRSITPNVHPSIESRYGSRRSFPTPNVPNGTSNVSNCPIDGGSGGVDRGISGPKSPLHTPKMSQNVLPSFTPSPEKASNYPSNPHQTPHNPISPLSTPPKMSQNSQNEPFGIRSTAIWRLPNRIFIHLMRFRLDENMEFVKPSHSIDMGDYSDLIIPLHCPERSSTYRYRIVGYITHIGNYGSGHYTCTVWCDDQHGWVEISDSHLNCVKPRAEKAYILVMERVR